MKYQALYIILDSQAIRAGGRAAGGRPAEGFQEATKQNFENFSYRIITMIVIIKISDHAAHVGQEQSEFGTIVARKIVTASRCPPSRISILTARTISDVNDACDTDAQFYIQRRPEGC